MKVNERVQIGIKILQEEITIPPKYDDEGNVVVTEHVENVEKEVPVMAVVCRDMTEEEIAEMQKQQEQLPPEEPSQLDRIEAQMMYTALMTDTLIEEG